MKIGVQRLYAQSHFQIICTEDNKDVGLLDEFIKRMLDNSKAAYERSWDSLSNVF